ncbi:hypothetical protein VNI00_011792 [Paramarasmius palmivorus]|uniref:Matrin-type domain-containing protein n=1 Tax=Paramarasmius palmivorus TaxID=297713 RepID=A0AAW0C8X1_9AGAR
MSEYWVSKKKYFCKYCEIYITDDAPSRQQHENGLRHKGNRDRFIRGLYKEGEKRKKDLEEEKREMARVEKAAQAAYSQDVGAGRARPTSVPSSSSTPSSTLRKPAKPSDPWTNYSTAASLGYTDPDVEKAQAEATRHREQGVAGDWEIVPAEPSQSSSNEIPPESSTSISTNNLKRPAETPVDQEDTRHFKLQKKTLTTGLGQIYDPGIITVKQKTKEPTETKEVAQEEPKTAAVSSSTTNVANESPKTTKWIKTQWKRPGEKGDESPEAIQDSDAVVKQSENELPRDAGDKTVVETAVKAESDSEVKSEPIEQARESTVPTGSSGGLFKKRKKPAASTGRIQV